MPVKLEKGLKVDEKWRFLIEMDTTKFPQIIKDNFQNKKIFVQL